MQLASRVFACYRTAVLLFKVSVFNMFDKYKTVSEPKSDKEFSILIKEARIRLNFGQRELARLINVSPSYLNELEQGKRSAPSKKILHEIQKILKIDEELLYNSAGFSKKSLAPDLQQFIEENISINSLLRVMKNLKFSEKKILELKNMITTQNYKAIIIAAGLGSRLGTLTKDLPKCLLKVNNKSILEHQLDAYKSNGISNISIVRGYKKEKINKPNVKYFQNDDYQNNNILNSLFYAESEINGNVIISYSDIIFAPHIVERLLESSADISIVVDVDWKGSYEHRSHHPIEEAENVIFDANHSVVDIGKIATSPADVHGEFIGMLKLSPKGAEIFKKHFHRAKQLFWDKPYQRAKTFQKAYITDFLKDMAELGVPIHSVIIEQGWSEIDTPEDLQNATSKF